MAQAPTPRSQRAIRDMGAWLRKMRLQRGHTITDVAAAIGRNFRYVSDVELGRRGHKMDPVVALLWCEYLVLEPEQMFAYLGLGDTELDRYRVQHYLQTASWAQRFTVSKRELQRALPVAEELCVALLKANRPEKAKAYQIRDAIKAALSGLRIPRNGKDGET